MKFELNTNLSKINNKIFEKKKNLATFEKINSSLRCGEDWTAWVNYPTKNLNEVKKVKNIAKNISKADVLIVLGIGGSYLGALAGLTALQKKNNTEVVFAGLNFSYEELENTFKKYADKNVYVNVISKSGTTTETLIAFEYAVAFLKKKYKKDFKNHLIITTDKAKGYLREYADTNNIVSLEVPDNVGGRYSVLTAVGLLPLCVGGVNIDKLFTGAITAEKELSIVNENNPAYKYALARHLLYKKGKTVELLSSFYPKLSKIGAWWTQLFAESEGKERKGLFVTNLNFSTDLHSVGQYIQQGSPLLFETFLSVNKVDKDLKLSIKDEKNPIKYIDGKNIDYVNKCAEKGTIEAHSNANVPVLQITIDKVDEEHIGYLFYFFELACAICCKMLGVNPFDQPGVEDYKRNMKKYLNA